MLELQHKGRVSSPLLTFRIARMRLDMCIARKLIDIGGRWSSGDEEPKRIVP